MDTGSSQKMRPNQKVGALIRYHRIEKRSRALSEPFKNAQFKSICTAMLPSNRAFKPQRYDTRHAPQVNTPKDVCQRIARHCDTFARNQWLNSIRSTESGSGGIMEQCNDDTENVPMSLYTLFQAV